MDTLYDEKTRTHGLNPREFMSSMKSSRRVDGRSFPYMLERTRNMAAHDSHVDSCCCSLSQPGYESHQPMLSGYESHGSVQSGYGRCDSIQCGYENHDFIQSGYESHDSVQSGYGRCDSIQSGYECHDSIQSGYDSQNSRFRSVDSSSTHRTSLPSRFDPGNPLSYQFSFSNNLTFLEPIIKFTPERGDDWWRLMARFGAWVVARWAGIAPTTPHCKDPTTPHCSDLTAPHSRCPTAPHCKRGPPLRIFHFLLLVLCLTGSALGFCPQDSCTNKYIELRSSLGVDEGSNALFCVLLRRYRECTMNFEGLCRGDINFHSNLKVINSLLARHECAQFGEDFDSLIESFSLDPENPDSQDTGGLGPCHYKGELRPRAHCGLFGDPHLRTFKGEFVTCRVEGAWPLLDTPHLAVQVTNVVVGPQLQATATSKVTVIVRGSDACGSGKTYEASAEQLPSAFVDGTRDGGVEASGAAAVWVQEVVPGQHVHVGVRVVNATVSIRRIQRYLSVSVTVPESVLGEEQGQGLCITSCPASETLSGPTHEAMPQAKAQELCAQHNLTDSFLDACVFDLVATGETFFRDAASAAQSELWSQDPQTAASTLRNCTQWPCTWPTSATESLAPLLAMVAVSVVAALLPLTLT